MFLLYVQAEIYQNKLKLRRWPLVFSLYKAFFFIKRGLKLVSLPHSLNDFWKKKVLTLYSIKWPIFVVWLSLLFEILDNMCILVIWCAFNGIINFEIKHSILIKPLFCITKKSGSRNLKKKSQEQKHLLTWNNEHFYNFFEGLLIVRNWVRPVSSSLSKFKWIKVGI